MLNIHYKQHMLLYVNRRKDKKKLRYQRRNPVILLHFCRHINSPKIPLPIIFVQDLNMTAM